jgi:hypothetical protein
VGSGTAYVRGQAYLLGHNGAAATADFQKLLDHRGCVLNFVAGALVHLQIGRAYAMAGESARRNRPTTISSPSGKTPTPTSLSEASQGGVCELAVVC